VCVGQVWYDALGTQPQPLVLTAYDPAADALVVALHTPAPPESRAEARAATPSALDGRLFRPFAAWDAWTRARASIADARLAPPPPPSPAGALLEPRPALPASAGGQPAVLRFFPADGATIAITHEPGADAHAAAEPPAGADGGPPKAAALLAHTTALAAAAAAAGDEPHPPLARATVSARGWALALQRRVTAAAVSKAAALRARQLQKMSAARSTASSGTLGSALGEEEEEEATPPAFLGDVELSATFDSDQSTMRVHVQIEMPTTTTTTTTAAAAAAAGAAAGAAGAARAGTRAGASASAAHLGRPRVWLTHGGADGRVTAIAEDGEIQIRWPDCAPAASGPPLEVARTVLANGVVVAHLSDGCAALMLRAGNAGYRHADGTLDIANNVGVRVRRAPPRAERAAMAAASAGPLPADPDDLSFLPALAVSRLFDAETGLTALARGDRVVVASAADGRTIACHADGTLIGCSADVEPSHGTRGEIQLEGGPRAPIGASGRVRLNLRTDEQRVACGGGVLLSRVYDPDSALHVLCAERPDGALLVVHAHAARNRVRAPYARFTPARLRLTQRLAYDSEGSYVFKLASAEIESQDVEGSQFRVRLGRPGACEAEPAPVDDFAAPPAELGGDTDAADERKQAEAEETAAAARALAHGLRPAPRALLAKARPTAVTGGTHPPRLFAFRADGSCDEWLSLADIAPAIAAAGASRAFLAAPPLRAGVLECAEAEAGTLVVAHPLAREPPSAYLTILSWVRAVVRRARASAGRASASER
jgi:hypothetical protein